MNYLYGDSTQSPLKSNFLEFLRDAIDFAAFVLGAEHNIRNWKKQRDELREEAAAETKRLQAFVSAVTNAIDAAPKGDPEKATARCAALMRTASDNQLQASIDAVEQRLASDLAAVDAEEAAERARCSAALETLLIPHAPPDARTVRSISLRGGDTYVASVAGSAHFGLSWQLALAIPQAWLIPVSVDRIMPNLSIRAPQLAGWISKEVKLKPQRLDRHIVIEAVDDGETLSVKLRAEANDDAGYDLEIRGDEVTAARVAAVPGKEDASLGAFDVDAADVPRLIELAGKLRAFLHELSPQKLENATFADEPFEGQASFVPIVERLVGMMAPITREIAERSLMPNELVIRRLLTDDRREEIFVTKASLRDKYAGLPEPLKTFFEPLGLDQAVKKRVSEAPPPEKIVRSQLTPSQPPPAMPPEPKAKNEALVSSIRNILALAKKGSYDDAYRAYETLFQSDDFERARPEDQRQSLKLMVMAKPPSATEAVIDAHLAAILRLQDLVEEYHEPSDYELLGLGLLLIEDTDAATRAFRAGLELERAKNPSSDLCARLGKRLESAAVV